ncbi:hypothetical protein Pan189_12630 [Stratiformator vulcanicus]|uniref:Uncharacterized protein n=1 Tax=Stratiformator vulcanicus TaxID=2527980 RepID=A0A517QZ25_9PLAN|nr:hypothetical protein Pan189_12630 [Stratiformator vulcanicus]
MTEYLRSWPQPLHKRTDTALPTWFGHQWHKRGSRLKRADCGPQIRRYGHVPLKDHALATESSLPVEPHSGVLLKLSSQMPPVGITERHRSRLWHNEHRTFTDAPWPRRRSLRLLLLNGQTNPTPAFGWPSERPYVGLRGTPVCFHGSIVASDRIGIEIAFSDSHRPSHGRAFKLHARTD